MLGAKDETIQVLYHVLEIESFLYLAQSEGWLYLQLDGENETGASKTAYRGNEDVCILVPRALDSRPICEKQC